MQGVRPASDSSMPATIKEKKTMYAIIEAGGAQHLVREGDTIKLNDPNFSIGDEILFDQVRLFSDETETLVGEPTVEGVTVKGVVRDKVKGPKVRIHKYRPRKASERRKGHRQKYSLVQIKAITRA